MTQQGLGGMRTGATGYGRQVQDKTYFQSELRQRISMINSEINNLTNEADTLEKDTANLGVYEKRAEALSEELKDLQGKLGDYNTLLDRLHGSADLDDIEKQIQQLKVKNASATNYLDQVFTQRQEKEMMVKDIERQIEEEKKKSEQLINKLPEPKRREYMKYKAENQEYTVKIKSMQSEIDQLSVKAKQLHEDLSKNLLKQKSLALHEQLSELKSKKSEMEQDLKYLDQDAGPQEKAKLLDQIKEDNLEMAGMERKISELEDQSKKLQQQIAHLDQAIEEDDQPSAEKNAKYEELLKRDKEMQAFIDTFDQKMGESRARNFAVESNIARLLENIQVLAKSNDPKQMPSSQTYLELKGDLKFKEKEMKNSESTYEALVQEREKRMADLAKVEQLEVKLAEEMESLNEKLQSLEEQTMDISDVETVKANLETTKNKNIADRESLLYARDHLRKAVTVLSTQHDAQKAHLTENETYTHLTALEQKLRHHESSNFYLKDSVDSKLAESDYKITARETMKITEEINQQLLSLLALPPGR